MSTVRAAVDLDGVVANYNAARRQRLALIANRHDPFDPEWHPTLWDWETSLGYSVKDGIDAWDSIRQDDTFWATLPAYPGAHVFLDWLWRAVSVANWSQGGSHEVYFLTDRSGHRAKDQSEIWLHKHGFSGKYPTVLLTRQGKARIIGDLQITHFLDDRPENVAGVCERVNTCQAFLLQRPWNVSEQDRLVKMGAILCPDLKDFQRRLNSEF